MMVDTEHRRTADQTAPFAAALRYSPIEHDAPRVTAAGGGKMAEKILEAARQHGIPIHEDPDLAAALSQLRIGQDIPPELYRVVAEILVFIYRMNRLASRARG